MGKRWKICEKWIARILALAFFCLSVLAVHDMQTAEGVGLYFALKWNRGRLPFDLAVDGLAGIGLLLLVLLPCIALRHKGAASVFRMLILFVSFMPRLSLAYLIRPWDTQATVAYEVPIFLLQTLAPFLFLAALALAEGDVKREKGDIVWRRWYSLCAAAAISVFAAAVFFPEINQLLYYVLGYLLLLVCFDLWERVYLKYPVMHTWGWILICGLALRAGYVLSQVFQKY